MRIIEVRHYHKGYVIFVNCANDINILSKNKQFKVHAVYRDPIGRSSGKEYYFTYVGSLKQAKAYSKRILGRKK